MPMGVTHHLLCYSWQSSLSYQRRFPVVYLTSKVMRRPQIANKQLEVYAFRMYIGDIKNKRKTPPA